MMTLQDYALDVDKTVEQIMELCRNLGIGYDDENSMLSQNDITLLDNSLQDELSDDLEEKLLDYEADDKAEELAMNTKFNLDEHTNFEKVKPRTTKKQENNKKEFLKERKNIQA